MARIVLHSRDSAFITLFSIKTGYLIFLYHRLFGYAMKSHVNLARQLLTGYLSAPYILHFQLNSADLIRVTTRSVEDFANVFMVNLLIALGELLVLVALTSLLMIVEPVATLGALVVLGVPTAPASLLNATSVAPNGAHRRAEFRLDDSMC